eukprot:CAMPEP_0181123866 /NCGR_PEP_ID=MMETSP1071-20121207/26152_1 /TAXON_ID=35127 /ORGANISM="Thalassiosira sp., Strain NH16" /LENGTH=744 /DNA_ID=CAMNT_0023209085 /DNA_START=18 /DNA_END=2252 /DNA_ORIENTATION=-
MRRALRAEGGDPMRDWTCETAHAHDDDFGRSRMHAHTHVNAEEDHDHHHDHEHHDHEHPNHDRDGFRTTRNGNIRSSEDGTSSGGPASSASSAAGGAWIEPSKYSFHVDLSIDIDGRFIERQGGAEEAVEYINVLVSAANALFEYEVDAHLNIVHIQEQTFYDTLTTVKDALRMQRLHPRPYSVTSDSGPSVILHHAILGRHVGGGIAFIDSVCDDSWGYGVTSDVSGNLNDMDDKVLFDFFVLTHELGHSLGSGHTFDAYDPPVDGCGACTARTGTIEGGGEGGEDGAKVTIEGLPRENAGTIMSYCNFCDGGIDNIAMTLGGVWDGVQPREDIGHWHNHPEIVGDVSAEPRRVSHGVWQKLSSKGECALPPSQPLPSQGCNDDEDCNDRNSCTIDVCDQSGMCIISETLDDCCGNGMCEPGERLSSCYDCGPFGIRAPQLCGDDDFICHALDGFMIDIGLSDDAERSVYVTSISLTYKSPEDEDATIDVYVTTEGSYVGKGQSSANWDSIETVTVYEYHPKRRPGPIEISLGDRSIHLEKGSRRGLYIVASDEILEFAKGPYSIGDKRGVELRSSLAVEGFFGTGIDGFGLSVEVGYMLDDGSESSAPTVSIPVLGSERPEWSDRVVFTTSSPSYDPTALPPSLAIPPPTLLPTSPETPSPLTPRTDDVDSSGSILHDVGTHLSFTGGKAAEETIPLDESPSADFTTPIRAEKATSAAGPQSMVYLVDTIAAVLVAMYNTLV